MNEVVLGFVIDVNLFVLNYWLGSVFLLFTITVRLAIHRHAAVIHALAKAQPLGCVKRGPKVNLMNFLGRMLLKSLEKSYHHSSHGSHEWMLPDLFTSVQFSAGADMDCRQVVGQP